MLIDTHCHIYYSEVENAEEIIKECKKNNIVMILNGIDKKSNLEVLELSKKYDNVYAAIGYDHSVVNEITDEDLKLLENQLKNEKVVAIGEIGLDYYWIKDNKEKQKKLFIKELELAEKYNLPVAFNNQYFRYVNRVISADQLGVLGIFIGLVFIGSYTVIKSIFQISIINIYYF